MRSVAASLCLLAFSLAPSFVSGRQGSDIGVSLHGAELIYLGKHYKPIESGEGWKQVIKTRAGDLVIRRDSIKLTGAWSAKPPAGGFSQVLGTTRSYAFFRCDAEGRDGDSKVLALGLKEGTWSSELKFQGSLPFGQRAEVLAIEGHDDTAAILYAITKAGKDDRILVSTTLQTLIGPKQTLGATANIPAENDGGQSLLPFLFAARYPNQAQASIKHLTWVGPNILVCASERGPIVEFDRAGREIFRIERPWEFRRGFIGPSVWSHILTRFGDDEFPDPEKPSIETARKDFEKLFSAKILAGPFFVAPTQKFLIAVRVSSKGEWDEYTGDCLLYEFDDKGRPQRRTALPQFVDGASVAVTEDGAIFATQNRGLMRYRVEIPNNIFMGPGGPDRTGEISWFRQFPEDRESHWLRADPARDIFASDGNLAIRMTEGWFADSAERKEVFFPLNVINLIDGTSRRAKLRIPLKKALKAPSENYYDGPGGMHAMGPYGVGITYLAISGNILRIQIASGTKTEFIDFSLALQK